MTYRELTESAYQILAGKPLCVSQGGEFKAFKNVSKINANIKNASLFCPLGLCKESLNIRFDSPRRIMLKKHGKGFSLTKIENFKLYMDLSGTFKLYRYFTYERTIRSLAKDMLLQFDKNATPEQIKDEEFQQKYLRYLDNIDALEICSLGEDAPLICDNAGRCVDRLRPNTVFETYDVVAYKFTNEKEKFAAHERMEEIASGRKSPVQMQINFDKVNENA